jgi:hypothetical protein
VSASFSRAREFVHRSGRVVEQRLFARLFEGAGTEGVVAAVLAYRNDDAAHWGGGWPIAWDPPGPAPTAAWRAIVTIDALRTLDANGRLKRSVH